VRSELGAAGADAATVLASVDANRAPAAALRVARHDVLRATSQPVLAVEMVALESDSPLLPR
jgi:hypothetical protein